MCHTKKKLHCGRRSATNRRVDRIGRLHVKIFVFRRVGGYEVTQRRSSLYYTQRLVLAAESNNHLS